jgi:selenocysteine-specific elongation factor
VTAVGRTEDGLFPAAAARLLGLPDAELVTSLVHAPLAVVGGRIVAATGLSAPLRDALDVLRTELARRPFEAPSADRLIDLGVDRTTLARLGRSGELLVLGDGIVLMPGADDEAARLLADLAQPFTTSQARQALRTSRRVVLPLLVHLDRTGLTVRLPDDRRRMR